MGFIQVLRETQNFSQKISADFNGEASPTFAPKDGGFFDNQNPQIRTFTQQQKERWPRRIAPRQLPQHRTVHFDLA